MDSLLQYETLPGGKRGNFRKALDFSDFRKQVWYVQPKKAGKFTWIEIYNWVDNPNIIVIGSGQPIYDQNKRLLGVVEVDLFLANIQDYLRSLKVTPNSKVFITEKNGLVVATSSSHLPFKLKDNQAKRLSLSDFPDPLIQASGQYLQKQIGNLDQLSQPISKPKLLAFEWQGKRQLLSVTPWQDQDGLKLLIGIIIPESDFTKTIEAGTQRTILLAIAATVLALIIGSLTAHWITDPILRLNQAVRHFSSDNFEGVELSDRS
ncbi:MAG: PDC sensor domain-containing protein, partial [Microcystaceae cyanobacterium]